MVELRRCSSGGLARTDNERAQRRAFCPVVPYEMSRLDFKSDYGTRYFSSRVLEQELFKIVPFTFCRYPYIYILFQR
jgi:hypothetical protein